MLNVHQRPLLSFVINYWKQFTNNFIFVTSFKRKQVYDFISKQPIKSTFIEEKETKGIANALFLTKNHCPENFIFVLGDCICSGTFHFPKDFSQGIGVWKTSNASDIKRSYAVQISNNLVSFVEEKPKKLINDLCGMGFYFFNKVVFDYIKKTNRSKLTGKVEITDVIQTMIVNGLKISPIFFEGDYLNVTYPEDLERAEKILF